MKIKIILLIGCFLTIFTASYAETINDILTCQKQIILQDSAGNPLEKFKISANNVKIFKDNVYVFDWENENSIDGDKCFFLHKYSMTGNEYQRILISRKTGGLLKMFSKKEAFSNFDISDKYLVLLAQHNIFIYLNHNNSFEYLKKIDVPNSITYNNIVIKNDNIVLTLNSITSQSIQFQEFTKFVEIDIESGKILKEKLFTPPQGLEQCLSEMDDCPTNTMNYRNGLIVLAQNNKYEIELFDAENFSSVAKLTRKPAEWSDLSDCKECFPEYNSVNISGQLYNNIQILNSIGKYYSVLKQVCFINDSMLYTAYTKFFLSPNMKWHYDIWEKNGSEWKVKFADLTDRHEEYSEFFGCAFPTGGYFVNIKIVPELIDLNQNPDQSALYKKFENYFLDNPLKYSLFIYKLK